MATQRYEPLGSANEETQVRSPGSSDAIAPTSGGFLPDTAGGGAEKPDGFKPQRCPLLEHAQEGEGMRSRRSSDLEACGGSRACCFHGCLDDKPGRPTAVFGSRRLCNSVLTVLGAARRTLNVTMTLLGASLAILMTVWALFPVCTSCGHLRKLAAPLSQADVLETGRSNLLINQLQVSNRQRLTSNVACPLWHILCIGAIVGVTGAGCAKVCVLPCALAQ